LDKREEQALPGSEGVWGRGRDGPNKVCTYEKMKKNKKETLIFQEQFKGKMSIGLYEKTDFSFHLSKAISQIKLSHGKDQIQYSVRICLRLQVKLWNDCKL
jgi:hypothetical protein